MLIDLQNGILGRKLEPLPADELVEAGKALARFRAEGAPVVLVNVAREVDRAARRRRALGAAQDPASRASSISLPAWPSPAI